jgi:hypothetical protein
MRRVVLLLVLAACSGRDDEPPPAAPGLAAVDRVAPPEGTGAAPASPTATATADASPGDPGGFHLDDATVEYHVDQRPARRKGRPIEVLLRSSPPGAVAAVDGEALGPTPALWQGEADGRSREFTFVLPGYATARYRFVPVRDGVVHGALDRLKVAPAAPPR